MTTSNITIAVANFSKYSFILNGGHVTVMNAKNEEVKMTGASKWRLTNDEGQRQTISTVEILEFAPKVAPEESEAKLIIDEPADQPAALEAPAADSNLVNPNEPAEVEADAKDNKPKRKVKLSYDDAMTIHERIASGDKQSVIAKAYDVHQSTIADIKAGRLYPKAKEAFEKGLTDASVMSTEAAMKATPDAAE